MTNGSCSIIGLTSEGASRGLGSVRKEKAGFSIPLGTRRADLEPTPDLPTHRAGHPLGGTGEDPGWPEIFFPTDRFRFLNRGAS
jgi:hypothetical protein